MKLLLIASAVLASGFVHAQYCTSGGPSSTVDSNVLLVRIVGQGDSIHHVGCPGVIGVQNLTNESVTLQAGNTYQLTVHFGTCNGNYSGSGEAWIDFDQSSIFDVSESVGTWSGIPPVAPSVFSVFVPLSTPNGPTRMRVTQQEGAVNTPLNPCAAFSWGSVMDFTIIITGGVDCSAYIGDDTNDPIIVPGLPYTNSGDNSYCYGNQNVVYPSPDVYYLVFPSAQSASISASLCGSTFDTFLSAIDPQGNVLAYNDDGAACAPQSQVVIPTAGEDSVYIIVEGWGSFMGAYTLQLNEQFVGVDEVNSTAYSLYPNPVDDYFVLSGVGQTQLVITDVSGNTVEIIPGYSGEKVNTEQYAAGVYFVHFDRQGVNTTEKIIITR